MPTDAMLALDAQEGMTAALLVALAVLLVWLHSESIHRRYSRAARRAVDQAFTSPLLQHSRSWAREVVRLNRGRRLDAGGIVLPMPVDPLRADPPLPELDGLAAFIVAPLLLTDAFRLPAHAVPMTYTTPAVR